MEESAGWKDPDTGLAPTYAEMMAVLSDLEGLVITAEFIEGLPNDITGLDNVVPARARDDDAFGDRRPRRP